MNATARLTIACVSLIVIGLMLTSISDAADPKPILTYHFDKDVKDSSGDYDAEIKGNPKYVKGMLGQALEFDGKDDYVLSPPLPIHMGQEFTISLWVKPSDPVTGTFIHISSEAGGGGWCTPLIGTHTGDVPAFLTYNMGPVVSKTKMVPDEWVYLAGVHTGPKSLIYVYYPKEKMSVAEHSGGTSDSGGPKYLSFAKISTC